MKYKTNSELETIIQSNDENISNNQKEQAKKILLEREGKSIDELIYEQNLLQAQKLNSINNMIIFFVVLTILSIVSTVWVLFVSPLN